MSTLDLASPRVVYDVHAQSWERILADPERYARLTTWVREQGLDPERIYRLEVYLIDTPRARVFEWKQDEQGRRYCEVEHDHKARYEACRIAQREPYAVILKALPPDL
ncbi:hypothetical protein MF672_010810 [Actinomadura sp. ATCC 31491]|uniref:Uncharacterized protein n=1 Tax=Actinomadura luzonensis TaxID=2805427 RepID=A0ABT0FPN9_9ACTN|nr:hypothetical protein [Actinomadura luzonensis]MCK2214277.1 hypothetical protein [Actinomadura luzonensis]